MSEKKSSDSTDIFTQSSDFFDQLSDDIKQARTSVCIQCMSFEADETGSKLIELLISKPTIKRTLLIDSYSKYVVNDTFVFGPSGLLNKNNALHEKRALAPLLDKAKKAGIEVKLTNPMGFMLFKYPVRNHKKVVLIDDHISYLGGINFTDHNFAWPDLMIRHTNPSINKALTKSFNADLFEKEVDSTCHIDDLTSLFILNGYKTKESYNELLAVIKKAQKITIVSPYISYPLLDAVAKVSNNRVILPKYNNKGYINFVHQLKRYHNVNYIYSDAGMVHMKLIIIDDSTVIYGSSNFDTISYLFEKEVVIKHTNPHLAHRLNQVAEKLITG